MAIRVSVKDGDFIEVVVEDFSEFVQDWAPFLSQTGIFVPTHQILLPGERYALEVQLEDGFPLIQARGVVAWTRDSSARMGPSGAALELDEVDRSGRELIERIEDRYVLSGGRRFEIESAEHRKAERVLIPEPDAQMLKEATLGSMRESASQREDGVMSVTARDGGPRFAPGMEQADKMRGGTMAPVQSGVWRSLGPGQGLGSISEAGPGPPPSGGSRGVPERGREPGGPEERGATMESDEDPWAALEDETPTGEHVLIVRRPAPGSSEAAREEEAPEVAANGAASARGDVEQPLWSEPVEAPPEAPQPHAVFQVDELFRIDDDDEESLEAELRASALEVSRTLSALDADGQAREPALEEPESTRETSEAEQPWEPEQSWEAEQPWEVEQSWEVEETREAEEPREPGAGQPDEAANDAPSPRPGEAVPGSPTGGPGEDLHPDLGLEAGLEELERDIDAALAGLGPPPGAPSPPVETGGEPVSGIASRPAPELDLEPEPRPLGEPAEAPPGLAPSSPAEEGGVAPPPWAGAPGSAPEAESLGTNDEAHGERGPAPGPAPGAAGPSSPGLAIGQAREPGAPREPRAPTPREDSVDPLDELLRSARESAPDRGETRPRPAEALRSDPMRELAASVATEWAPWAGGEPERSPRRWPSVAELSAPLRVLGLLLLAPVFVMLYLGVQRCYGDPVRDAADLPSLGPPERMPLADGRSVLENPGRSLWELSQQEGATPEVRLLVTTPIGRAARRVVAYGAEAVEGGGTRVTLEGDGSFGPVSTVHLRLDDGAPREVLKISGIVEPPGGAEHPVGTAEVQRLRFGYHLRRQYNELQVVADLAGPGVRLTRITVEPRRLVLLFEQPPGG